MYEMRMYTSFRASEKARDAYKVLYKRPQLPKRLDETIIYKYYGILWLEADLKAWTFFFVLFLIVFPTGNTIAERGFSAMGAAHNSRRSELGHPWTKFCPYADNF